MAASAGTRQALPPFLLDEREHRRQIAAWMREVHQGKLANTGSVTLTANVASTTVTDARAGAVSFIGFMPRTANAAAELGAGTMYVATQGKQTFTITHANNAQTDRTFRYCLLG